MSNAPLMPMATAVWLVENTTLTFKQIANFCNLHELEIKGIADGNGEFSKHFDLATNKSSSFMGIRCKRFAMIIHSNNIKKIFIEEAGQFVISSAENILIEI